MRGLAGVMVLWLSGCSLLFVHGPPENHQQLRSFHCTESEFAPEMDTVLAVLQTLNFAFANSQSDAEWNRNFPGGDPPFSHSAALPLYAVFAVVEAISAGYGYQTVSSCREAQAQATGAFGRLQGPAPSEEALPVAPPAPAPAPHEPTPGTP
jgi:hypothetical protein